MTLRRNVSEPMMNMILKMATMISIVVIVVVVVMVMKMARTTKLMSVLTVT